MAPHGFSQIGIMESFKGKTSHSLLTNLLQSSKEEKITTEYTCTEIKELRDNFIIIYN